MKTLEHETAGRRERKVRRHEKWYGLYIILFYTFIYIPIAVSVIFSFNDQKKNTSWQGFTFSWWQQLFADPDIWQVVLNTLLIALISTAFATVIGTLGAVGMVRHEFKGRQLLNSAVYVPIVIPEIVLAVALLCIYMKIGFPLGLWSIILGHTTLTLPYVVINVKSRLAGYDKSLEEAAMDLGANQRQTFLKVTLPMIVPGIMSGSFLAFTLSLDDLAISNFVTGIKSTTLPLEIQSMLRSGISPEINALTTLIMLVVAGAYILFKVILPHKLEN